MSRSKDFLLIVAVVTLATFTAAPLALSQDQRQDRLRNFVAWADHDDGTNTSDGARCRPNCHDSDCAKDQWRDDDKWDEDSLARCEAHCREQDDCEELAISPQFTAVALGGSVHFKALNRDRKGITWSASVGTISDDGDYVAPSGSQSVTATVTATSKKDPTEFATATIHLVAPGQVSATANVQVALYSISPGAPANVSVEFGEDTNYRLETWEQPVPVGGGPVSLFVAGMKGGATYHMRAIVQFSDGARFVDYDNTFLTGSLPSTQLPEISVTRTPGLRPQEGIELLDMVIVPPQPAPLVMATDLEGNVIWTYTNGDLSGDPQPIKLLSNGHFLINYVGSIGTGASVIQEVDLAGNLIWQMSLNQLNTALAAATCAGCNLIVNSTHHDFAPLPNGHFLLIAQTTKNVSGTFIYGDVIIDLDPNHKPVWIWNEFDHLDTNRRPYGFTPSFPDWTHTNAIIYSPDDGDFIVSIRHQSWLVKVDYQNGNGTGDVIWKLGYQGDFALIGGTDPTDWFFTQHGPSFIGKNSSGIFSLALFDNGDSRVFPPSVTCGAMDQPACLYSTVPILRIDEKAMTATFVSHLMAPGYSVFGGNAEVLENGNLEFTESEESGPDFAGNIYEVHREGDGETVWHLNTPTQWTYRGMRIPSLYPGVQWRTH